MRPGGRSCIEGASRTWWRQEDAPMRCTGITLTCLLVGRMAAAQVSTAPTDAVIAGADDRRSLPAHLLFPGRGRLSVSGSTGVPLVAGVEVAYGVGDRFAVGVVGGTTPGDPTVGLRLRGLLWSGTEQRVYAVMPFLYYNGSES